jgi:sulfatase modifying factor 1
MIPFGQFSVSFLRPGRFLVAATVLALASASSSSAAPETLTVPGLNLTMVKITRGTFMMGHPEGYPGSSSDERPVTTVTFSKDFWLGATDVTVAQFRQFVEETKYVTEPEATGGVYMSDGRRPGTSWKNPGYTPDDNFPVVGISWNDAMKFCEWLDARERKAGRIPEGYRYTLPTEAQWEYAARAGSTDDPAPDEFSWYDQNSGGKIHAVGLKKPNPWGLYDMLGLVWQWVADWRGPYPGGHFVDWEGPEIGTTRMNRSGSYGSPKGHGIMSTNRWSTPGLTSRTSLGFRVALRAPGTPQKVR